MKTKNNRVYTTPKCYVLHVGDEQLMKTISTKVDSDGATTGGRAKEINFEAFSASWDEETETEVEK